jgi:hypothetical protein
MTTFEWARNVEITSDDIPRGTEKIKFDFNFNFNIKIRPGVIPDTVTYIYLGGYNIELEPGVIPSSVKTLTFGKFNKKLKRGDIPEGVETLSFGSNFNKKLKEGDIPSSVTILRLEGNKILERGIVPRNVVSLTFGGDYYQDINEGVLPEGLKVVRFQNAYRYSFQNLPRSVKYIYINFSENFEEEEETLQALISNLKNFNRPEVEVVFSCENIKFISDLRHARDEIPSKLLCYNNFDEEGKEDVEFSIESDYVTNYISRQTERMESIAAMGSGSEEQNADPEFELSEEEQNADPEFELSEEERLRNEARAEEQMRLTRERNMAMLEATGLNEEKDEDMEEKDEDMEETYRNADYPDIPDEESDVLKHKCNNDSDFMGENLTYKSGVQVILNITRDEKYVAYCYNYGELIQTLESHDYQIVVWGPNGRGYFSPDRTRPVYKEPYLGFWIDHAGYENAKIYNTLVAVPLAKERLGTSAPNDGTVGFSSRMHGHKDDIHMVYTLRPVHFHTFHNREKITRDDIDNFQPEKRDLLPRNSHLEEKENIRLVTLNPMNIKDIINPSVAVQLEAARRNGYVIRYIKDPSEEVQLEAVRRDGYAIEFIKDPSEAVQLEAVREDRRAIQFINNTSEIVQLEAVRQDGRVIKFIKDPLETVQLEAVRQDGFAIQFIKDPSEEVQLEAVREDGRAIRYIKNPFPSVIAHVSSRDLQIRSRDYRDIIELIPRQFDSQQ